MKQIIVDEQYQKDYSYHLKERAGINFRTDFKPELTPKQMLYMGIFGGYYFKTLPKEFPEIWFSGVKYSSLKSADKKLNYFKVNASQSLKEWQKKGWIYDEDPMGWFLWYCRYYLGRRIPEEDDRQIRRWKNMKRHASQVEKFCTPGDLSCRPRQRQALLHWAYDSRNI
jgi:hypothetical protein